MGLTLRASIEPMFEPPVFSPHLVKFTVSYLIRNIQESLIMQNYLTVRAKLAISCFILALGGCASEPAPVPAPEPLISGEEMLRESQGIANLGDRWKKGKQLVDRGNAMIAEGQNKINEGRRIVEEGERIMRESEENYKSIKK